MTDILLIIFLILTAATFGGGVLIWNKQPGQGPALFTLGFALLALIGFWRFGWASASLSIAAATVLALAFGVMAVRTRRR